MRISEREYELMMKNSQCKVIEDINLKPPAEKTGRVNSKKTIVDGYEFDSAKEARIYYEMKLDPEIEIVELQPEFVVFPAFKRNGKIYAAIKFTPDFKVLKNGLKLIIEVKSTGTLKANSKSYPMRRKLFLARYPELSFMEIIFDKNERTEKQY